MILVYKYVKFTVSRFGVCPERNQPNFFYKEYYYV